MMPIETFEGRIANLEGSYQQISDRLNGMDRALGDIRTDMTALRTELSSRVDRLLVFMLGTWITLMAAILLHH